MKHAEDIMADEDYDLIYCVFDRDTHSTYEAAKSKVLTLAKRPPARKIKAITSVPCIEYWFLIHFEHTRAPINAIGKKSCGQVAEEALKQQNGFADYGKKLTNAQFEILWERHDEAMKNGALVERDAEATAEWNPSSLIHKMIAEILALKEAERLEREKSYAKV